MIATDMSSSGDPAEKLRQPKIMNKRFQQKISTKVSRKLILRWAFRMYDKDNSGEIDLDEMVEIFCLMYAVQVLFRISLKVPFSLIFQGFSRIFENILILNISSFF